MMRIIRSSDIEQKDILLRSEAVTQVGDIVAEVLQTVRDGGDRALLDYCERFDGTRPAALELTQAELDAAMAQVDPAVLDTLRQAAARIENYHKRQIRQGFTMEEEGVVLMQRVLPLERVGVYVPGGTASYPSTVLMNVIPAKLAGVKEIVMVSPPRVGGTISPVILAAAKIAGIDRVFRIGGAQAIAALAYGTESVPQVDKIVGPGNAFVAEAKKQVFGTVGIDMVGGPSGILVLADGTCDPKVVAADLLSQAEHDKMASAVLVTPDEALALAVQQEVEAQLQVLPREDIARTSIEGSGKILLTKDLDEAIDLANRLAPEHLELCVDEPFNYIARIRNAGSVFLGKNCPEALGDYFAGPNHTLPTSGTARFASPLSVDDFVKKMSCTYYTKEALSKVKDSIALLARQEGLEAHARSPLSRFDEV